MDGVRVQRLAGLARTLVAIPLTLLLLLLALLIGNFLWQGGGPWVPFMLIYYAPMLLYIAAIVWAWQALGQIARGDVLAKVLPSLLTRAGGALFLGAILTQVGVPVLSWALLGEAYIRSFEPSAVTLAVVGLTMMVVGLVFRRVIVAHDELEQFV